MTIERVADLRTGAVSERAFTPPTPTVPQSVTKRQAKLALHAIGKLENAQDAVIDAGIAAQIEWDDANTYERSNPLIVAIGTAIGLTSEQIDDLFRDAATR